MPTPIDITIGIILDPSSRMRETTPLIYQLPKDSTTEHETRIRYLDISCCAARSVRGWLRKEYGGIELQVPPFDKHEDQSDIFAMIREPKERWWSGVREWMNNLPWYAWWQNEKVMAQWPHFNRFTIAQHVTLNQVEVKHLIKVDPDLDKRMVDFARKHRLRLYGPFERRRNYRYVQIPRKEMEDKGRSQLQRWLKKNPKCQEQLDIYLKPDYDLWDKVKNQE